MTETLEDLERYVAAVQQKKEAQFVAAYPFPFVVRISPETKITDNPWEEQFAFSTDVRDSGADADDEDQDAPAGAAIVAPVRKKKDGLFPDRIVVGRARNCDVVLRYPSISKVHAQFFMEGEQLCLVDVGSSNGTLVNGTRLVARARNAVKLGDRLQFGAIELELIDAKMLYTRLKGLS